MTSLEDALATYDRLRRPSPDGAPWSHHRLGSRRGSHVVFGCMVHGNESGTLPAAIRLIQALEAGEVAYTGPVSLFLGNPEAARADRRFLDFDLNRAWSFEPGRSGHEIDRANALRPLIDRADVFLDLHQTILATDHAFWTFPWDPVFGQWARVLQTAPTGITRARQQVFASDGLLCIDEYVRAKGRPGFTVELGQKGFDADQADNAFRTMVCLLETLERVERGQTTLEAEAAQAPPVRWFQTVHREDWGEPTRRLQNGLASWTSVTAGTDLAASGSPPVTVPRDGVLLFPKYPGDGEPLPAHLFHLGIEMQRDPSDIFGV